MLDQMRQRLHVQRSFEGAIHTILEDVVALHGAEFGDIQLPIDDYLVIVAQKGLPSSFLRAFRKVRKDTQSACGRALRLGRTVVIADVETDRDYAPYREAARKAGYRAVQSTPLLTREGLLLGVVSTHFANAHGPTPIEISTLQSYARIAAEYLRMLLAGAKIATKAKEMSSKLYATLEPEEA